MKSDCEVITNIGCHLTSGQLMPPPGALDKLSVVCSMHDVRKINLREPTILTNPSEKLTNPTLISSCEDRSSHIQVQAQKRLVKFMQWVKTTYLFSHVMRKLFYCMILSSSR